MTRINLVEPKQLISMHLVAEYGEILDVFRHVEKHSPSAAYSKAQKYKRYLLGSGHVMFFYSKLRFLMYRRDAILNEMLERGMNPDIDKYKEWKYEVLRKYSNCALLWNDYFPSPEEVYLSFGRLAKMSQLPDVLDDLGHESYKTNGLPVQRRSKRKVDPELVLKKLMEDFA